MCRRRKHTVLEQKLFFDEVTRKKKAVEKVSTIWERDKKNVKYYVGDYFKLLDTLGAT